MKIKPSKIQTFVARLLAAVLVGTGVWLGSAVLVTHFHLSVSETTRAILTFASMICCWLAASGAMAFAEDLLDVPAEKHSPPKRMDDWLLSGKVANALKAKGEIPEPEDAGEAVKTDRSEHN